MHNSKTPNGILKNHDSNTKSIIERIYSQKAVIQAHAELINPARENIHRGVSHASKLIFQIPSPQVKDWTMQFRQHPIASAELKTPRFRKERFCHDRRQTMLNESK